ncbi:MAG: bifunctional adenosylcobinamide kinase/adenosylcobinamide-phosphate guanylyltransferase [Thiotrichaceae bacterium]|nr:bifunctional adenosylcobinamide kinase/adenosylcobinamide-phosphate guanylyltransferase [Thiotrichaceae bacterium]
MNQQYLILGGARSGKSRYAEQLASQLSDEVIYIATAQAHDNEMQQRIEQHKKDRPSHWLTIEEPQQLADTLLAHDKVGSVLLVDCLTLWLNNLLCSENETLLKNQLDSLLNTLPQLKSPIILVSNEVGMGIIPLGKLSRLFVDESGRLHQRIAYLFDQVVLMTVGIPQYIKGQPYAHNTVDRPDTPLT